MARKFITTILAAAVALSTMMATPGFARDRSRETVQILAGISALFILGKIVENKNKADKKKKAEKAAVTRRRIEEQPTFRPRSHTHAPSYADRPRSRPYDRGHITPRPIPQDVARKLLPSSCSVRGYRRGVAVDGFTPTCLNRSFSYASRLPAQCLREVQIDRRDREIYSRSCLIEYGYRVSSR